jgi:hypothetical protein
VLVPDVLREEGLDEVELVPLKLPLPEAEPLRLPLAEPEAEP